MITISNEASVRNLHTQIQQQLPQPFRNVPFYLRAFRSGPVRYVTMKEEGCSISEYFDKNITMDVHHVFVEED
ncbi:9285_t:CDS:2 [Funneliformis geosporum]|uniref:9285_t:CDS:1 n=1 Tax=Funneliformis geosporum TaxID=1117311 RepID=A0A9W4T7C3_9GLOM|nr:9285_t:CDS:2 [Funneliformis geosporum]